jgi:hypothetical protein
MKSTDAFKNTIQAHLDGRAEADPLFAETLKKENKNIEDCCTYILNQVKNSGCNGFEDSEIFGMAVHYYDEDDIKPGAKITANVVVNHTVQLTPEEIEEAKKKAFDSVVAQEQTRLTTKKKPEAKKESKEQFQESLF